MEEHTTEQWNNIEMLARLYYSTVSNNSVPLLSIMLHFQQPPKEKGKKKQDIIHTINLLLSIWYIRLNSMVRILNGWKRTHEKPHPCSKPWNPKRLTCFSFHALWLLTWFGTSAWLSKGIYCAMIALISESMYCCKTINGSTVKFLCYQTQWSKLSWNITCVFIWVISRLYRSGMLGNSACYNAKEI